MKKLGRFALLATFFVVYFIGVYSVIPIIIKIFGGSFFAVVQHPVYILFGGCGTIVGLGYLFSQCFDNKFYSKD